MEEKEDKRWNWYSDRWYGTFFTFEGDDGIQLVSADAECVASSEHDETYACGNALNGTIGEEPLRKFRQKQLLSRVHN